MGGFLGHANPDAVLLRLLRLVKPDEAERDEQREQTEQDEGEVAQLLLQYAFVEVQHLIVEAGRLPPLFDHAANVFQQLHAIPVAVAEGIVHAPHLIGEDAGNGDNAPQHFRFHGQIIVKRGAVGRVDVQISGEPFGGDFQ